MLTVLREEDIQKLWKGRGTEATVEISGTLDLPISSKLINDKNRIWRI